MKIGKPLEKLRVACVTPTYDRHRFLRQARRYFLRQDYPYPENLHCIILDDSPEPIENFDDAGGRIHYRHQKTKKPIGAKRNWLNKAALKGKFDIVCSMDDDDWYSPKYVSSMVDLLMNSDAPVAGSSQIYMLDVNTMKIVQLGPYRKNHTCNGVLCFKTKYARNHSYDENAQMAEEGRFLDRWKTEVIQHPDPRRIFLGLIHPANTVSKEKAGRRKETNFKLLNYGVGQRDAAFYIAERKRALDARETATPAKKKAAVKRTRVKLRAPAGEKVKG
jgi:glycosyltransferase involved in cell wall biosynthesis